MPDKNHILIVDRERFSALICRMLEGSFVTDSAADGMQAIKKMRLDVPQAVIVDQDIPGNGVRLAELLAMNPKYQEVALLLTSAKPSPDSIIRARQAGVNAFLAKPFRPSELVNRINTAIADIIRAAAEAQAAPGAVEAGGDDGAADETAAPPQTADGQPLAEEDEEAEDSEAAGDIKSRVQQIEGLPPFPATHAEILKLAKSEDASADDLAGQIQMDPSLIATVLKLANSSYYGFTKKTDSLSLAVTRLGMEEVANLIMTAQVFEKLGGMDEGEGLDIKEFWKHSVGAAFAARSIAKKLQTEVESSFLAGMLHDVGKIVLDRFFGEYYKSVMEVIESDELAIVDAEREVLGITHADVGGQLATEWKFSNNYLYSILHHHTPRSAKRSKRLVAVIHLANHFCRKLEFGSGGDSIVPEIDQSVLDQFSLGDRGLQILEDAILEDLEDANSFLNGLAS
jgi:putative nucleotidyltransferase with HDIG domain